MTFHYIILCYSHQTTVIVLEYVSILHYTSVPCWGVLVREFTKGGLVKGGLAIIIL